MNRSSAKQTVGFPSSSAIREVPEESWDEFVQWIHYQMGQTEIGGLLSEMRRRLRQHSQAPRPIEAVENNSRVAGAYLLLAPGKVASLGGVRVVSSHTLQGIQLVNQLNQQAIDSGARQIQAIVNAECEDVSDVLLAANFKQLSVLKHLWLQLPSPGTKLHQDLLSTRFVPTSQFAKRRVEALLASTFDGTLDCPALNGLRDPNSILESFLDGHSLRGNLPWWIVQHRDEEVGCLLLNEHAQAVAELAYMGLKPAARGRGLGHAILQAACQKAQTLGSTILVAAVDCENWPAVRLYEQAGFHEHRRLQAWFRM